jgi:hypothetical protein
MTIFLMGLLAIGCGSEDSADGDHDHHHGDATLPADFDDSTEKITESGITVSYTTDPVELIESEEFSVIITYDGGTITEADATMPNHGGHGMNVEPDLDPQDDGTVVASPFQFHMPGYWILEVKLKNDNGDVEQVRFDMACCD